MRDSTIKYMHFSFQHYSLQVLLTFISSHLHGFCHIAQFVMENNLEIINLARKQFQYFSFYRYVACNTEEPSFDTLSTSVCCLLIPSPVTSAICLELQISFETEK